MNGPVAHKQHYVKPIPKFISFKMELQISSDICAQEKEKRNLRKNQERISQDNARTGTTKRKQNHRRESQYRPCTHVH